MTRHLSDQNLVAVYQTCHHVESNGALPWQKDAAGLVRTLLGTGCRIGELCGPRGILVADCQPPLFRIREGKTETSARTVKCMPELQTHFARLVARSREERAAFLFPFTVRTGQRYWTWILEQAGIEHQGVHASRRTFLTWEINAGRLNPLVAQKLVGHKSIKTTSVHYFEGLAELAWEENPEIKWRKEAEK